MSLGQVHWEGGSSRSSRCPSWSQEISECFVFLVASVRVLKFVLTSWPVHPQVHQSAFYPLRPSPIWPKLLPQMPWVTSYFLHFMTLFLVFIFPNFLCPSEPSLLNLHLHLLRVDIEEGTSEGHCSVSPPARHFVWCLLLLPHFRCCLLHVPLAPYSLFRWLATTHFCFLLLPTIPAQHFQRLDGHLHWDVHQNLKISMPTCPLLSCSLSPFPSLSHSCFSSC